MDTRVLETQIWLNKTYTGRNGYTKIAEDGKTGWGTMKALVTALQIELGISTPNGNFGPATTSAFQTLERGSSKANQVYILQGGLFCKGYNPTGFNGTFGPGTEAAVKSIQEDAGIISSGKVNALLMKSVLNMDAFIVLDYGAYHGDNNIRTIQRYLNKNYSSNSFFAADIGLVPCDGIYGRSTNKALLYAFQIEEGIKEPNGVFGPSTSSLAPVLSVGSTKTKFVYLLQFGLYCNGFNPNGFDGQFGNGAKNAVIGFQKFSALAADGIVGMQTWASLMVSTGDRNRKGTMCDCATTITDAKAKTIKKNGYVSVGRYLTGRYKMTATEINTILSNGLRIFPILETGGYQLSYFNAAQGNNDAKEAIEVAHKFGFDEGTIIYFTVDFDALDIDVTRAILPYFNEIYNVFKRTGTKYKIGIYGPRNVCSRVSQNGYSCSSFVCDMSTGFSGNLGYPLPKDWAIDQISTISIGSGEGWIEIDNNISSGRDLGVSKINLIDNSANGKPDLNDPPISGIIEEKKIEIEKLESALGLTKVVPGGKKTNTIKIPGLYITLISDVNVYTDTIPTMTGGTQIYYGKMGKPTAIQSPIWALNSGEFIDFVQNYEDGTFGVAAKIFDSENSTCYFKILSNLAIRIEFYFKASKYSTVSFELELHFRADPFGPPTDHPIITALKVLNGEVLGEGIPEIQFISVALLIGGLTYVLGGTNIILGELAMMWKSLGAAWNLGKNVMPNLPNLGV